LLVSLCGKMSTGFFAHISNRGSPLLFRNTLGLYECMLLGHTSFYVPVRPSKPVISLGGPAIEGKPLTLTCVSTGGYPRQNVSWYRGSVAPGNRLSASEWFVNNTLYDVISRLTFIPTIQDDGVLYICQSSYSDEPRLIETSHHNLLLARMYLQ